MATPLFLDVFGEYFGDDIKSDLLAAVMSKCNLDIESRTLLVSLNSDKYIKRSVLGEVSNTLKTYLKLTKCEIDICFSADAFCVAACEDIINEIRCKSAVLNGYFNGVDYGINGDEVTITLKHGGFEKIKNSDFEKMFLNICGCCFGKKFSVKFDGQLLDVEIEAPKPTVSTAQKPQPKKADEKPQIKFEARKEKPENGVVYLDNPKLFYGRRIDNNVKRMIDVTPDDTMVSCWGEVFGLETRKINTRRGEMNIVNFAVSDYTNSISASLFIDINKMDDIKNLKNGNFILINGSYEFDNYKKEHIIKPTAMALLQPYFEMDEYEGEKRIELHCHTNMSDKDAVCPAEALIEQAYKWGHKAIAITDHGVVQAYPAAAGAVKKIRKAGGDFKVIYGVEGYFVDDINNDITNLAPKQIKRYHQIILVKNMVGLKNLYKLVSDAHINNFKGRPLTLRSKLDELREGLIIGSACEAGELYQAIFEGKPHEELLRIASYYDYLEIQPLGNNDFMVRKSTEPDEKNKKGEVIPNPYRHVTSVEMLKAYNRKVVEIADELHKPVVATGDVHFLKKSDEIIRKILLAGQNYDDFDHQAPLYLKTTQEMLDDFSYFGDRAYEFVVENPNKIAEMVSGDIIPVPEESHPPVIEGSDDMLRDICWANARKKYGEVVPEVVVKRLEKELNAIISNGFSIMYISAQKLVAFSEENGYLVGSRGSVGSSFVATIVIPNDALIRMTKIMKKWISFIFLGF